MAKPVNVAVIVGSLRKDSFNRRIARLVIDLAPPSLHLAFVEIGDLPLYNQDLETATPPPPWQAFRDAIRAADALLFVTPEYNRGIPGGLKNAIDVGSRPSGKSAWSGAPAGVISVTQGPLGAFGSHHALRQSLVGINVATMPFPEMYIGQAASLFDADGKLVNDKTRDLLQKFLAAYEQWITRNARAGT